MKIHFRKRSRASLRSFVLRTFVLLCGFVVLANAGYLMAQAMLADPGDLMRQAIGGDQFLFNVDWFLYLRQSPVIPSFGVAIVAFVVIALGHFFTFGPKDMSASGPDDVIPWWTLTERILHAIIVVSFCTLLVSGLSITFGRYLGGGTSTLVLRTMHEYAGFVYGPVFVVLILIWTRDALFRSYDLEWFAKFGGYLGYKGELRSGKFNAGQKLYFWIMAVTGVIHILSGYALFFQYGNMADLRFYVVMHFLSTIPMVLMFLVHLYMTTLGTRGAMMGMINGRFSRSAALKFHSEARDLKKLGAVPAEGND